MEPPEIELHPDLLCLARIVFDKPGYTSFTPDVRTWIRDNNITKLYCCGIATEGCVLKTAVDAFEADIEPVVVHDACASHAGRTQHEAGLFVLARFIGKGQIQSIDEVVCNGFA
jgi:nicotinamidase-related amidase